MSDRANVLRTISTVEVFLETTQDMMRRTKNCWILGDLDEKDFWTIYNGLRNFERTLASI
jgi:hypothetical protein